MTYKFRFFIPLVIMLFSACANNKIKNTELDEIFITDIKASGLKIFSYSLSIGMPGTGGHSGGQLNGKGKRRGGDGMGFGMSGERGNRMPDAKAMLSRITQILHEKLDYKLAETGYCRDGYIELSSNIGRGRSQIRGECKEGATENDRDMFPTITSTPVDGPG